MNIELKPKLPTKYSLNSEIVERFGSMDENENENETEAMTKLIFRCLSFMQTADKKRTSFE